METFQPTCLLGLAGQPSGLFTEDLIKLMTANCEMLNQRPIIMVSPRMPIVLRRKQCLLSCLLTVWMAGVRYQLGRRRSP